MSDGMLHHTSLSPGQDKPAGGSWHMVWAKAGDHASRANRIAVRAMAYPLCRAPFFPANYSTVAGGPILVKSWTNLAPYRLTYCNYGYSMVSTGAYFALPTPDGAP